MANREDLERLTQGMEQWNQWRAQHRTHLLNLSGVDLSGARLSEIDLSGADLSRAKLSRVNLYEADLRDIPWLTIMELTLQPGIVWKNVLYDRTTAGEGEREEPETDENEQGLHT